MTFDYVICDIDGTISDASHRLHYVQNKPKNWRKFFEECINDPPHHDVIQLLKILKVAGYKILLVSGRSDIVMPQTVNWLKFHDVPCWTLFMRKNGDYRADDIMKEEMFLTNIKPQFGLPFLVLDDRDRVVSMWRANGIRCLQVAPGNF